MKNRTIHIACNIDSKYTRYCGVLMVSLFENNKNEHIKIHILCYHLTKENKQDLKDIATYYNNEVQFYDVDESTFVGFPISEQWPIVIYFRLILPNIIDQTVDKILYVDCDIIFRGPIQELMNIELNNYVIGAVEDGISPYAPIIEELGYDPKYYYFNSGSLLINLPLWRNLQISQKCIEYIKTHHVIHPDQDALNAILYDKWLRLSYKWNNMSHLHTKYMNMHFFLMDKQKKTRNYPIIIHYTGEKPWYSNCKNPFKDEFFEYQARTKWANCIPRHTLYDKIEYLISIILDKLCIRKRNPYYLYKIK